MPYEFTQKVLRGNAGQSYYLDLHKHTFHD